MMKVFQLFSYAFFICFLMISCKKDKADSTKPEPTDGCEENISFAAKVKPIIDANCVHCHDGSGPHPRTENFNEYSQIESYKIGIKNLTANGSMPPDGKLSAEEIKLIGCWVDQGAKNN